MKILLTTFLLGSILNLNSKINTDDVFYINDNKVEMTEENYNKLLQLGYTERELKYLTQKEYNEKSDFNVCATFSQSYIQKTTTYYDKNGIVKSNIQNISEEQSAKELQEKNSSLETMSTKESYNYVDEYKKFTFFGSTIKYNEDDNEEDDNEEKTKYFVKVNLDWLTTPIERYEDFIGIVFSDVVQIQTDNSIIFESSFIYTQTTRRYYSTLIDVIQNDSSTVEYIVRNPNEINYNADEGLTVEYDLPLDINVRDCGSTYLYEYQVTNQKFSMSLSATFFPTLTTLISAPFAGVYSHKKIGLNISIGGIELSFSAPYFGFPSNANLIHYYESVGTYVLLDTEDVNWPTC